MGDVELVPYKVEHWAYAGDSIARRGFQKAGSPHNTDIGSYVAKFSGGRVKFDNYGRSCDTTDGMLGKQKIRGERKDSIAKVLKGNYEGIIIEIGVNDLGGSGGTEQNWKKKLAKMRRNIMEMYLRACIKGTAAVGQQEVPGKIEEAIAAIEKKEKNVLGQLDSCRAKNMRIEALVLEDKRLELVDRKEILKTMHGLYGRLAGNRRGLQKGAKRIVFVEVAPWKHKNASTKKAGQRALRTREYNTMLKSVGREINGIFEGPDDPRFEVAEIHGIMGSKEDKEVLRQEYVGKRVDGKEDYLHFGDAGRRRVALEITKLILEGREVRESVPQKGGSAKKAPAVIAYR